MSQLEWMDTYLNAAMELPVIDGSGKGKVKVRVLLTIQARHLEDHPEFQAHHNIMTGERWDISLASCGYRIAQAPNLKQAAKIILKLAIAGEELGIDWSKLTPEAFNSLPVPVRRSLGEIVKGE